MQLKRRWQSFLLGVIGAMALSSISAVMSSAQAAQTVVLRRGSFNQTIEVEDLKRLVETDTVPPKLKKLSRMLTTQQRSQLQTALKAKFNINPVAARKLLNTEFGNNLSSALATVTSRQDSVGVQSVETALILGARSPEGLSIISFIEAYPREELSINLDRA
ncbi:MAG TPA: alpha/beta hydrolase, partial [Coleofasciculaceae cyanobacterium]